MRNCRGNLYAHAGCRDYIPATTAISEKFVFRCSHNHFNLTFTEQVNIVPMVRLREKGLQRQREKAQLALVQ